MITERWKFSWVPSVFLFITFKMLHVVVQKGIHQKKKKIPIDFLSWRYDVQGLRTPKQLNLWEQNTAEDTTIVLESWGCGREREITHYSSFIRVLICACIWGKYLRLEGDLPRWITKRAWSSHWARNTVYSHQLGNLIVHRDSAVGWILRKILHQ